MSLADMFCLKNLNKIWNIGETVDIYETGDFDQLWHSDLSQYWWQSFLHRAPMVHWIDYNNHHKKKLEYAATKCWSKFTTMYFCGLSYKARLVFECFPKIFGLRLAVPITCVTNTHFIKFRGGDLRKSL